MSHTINPKVGCLGAGILGSAIMERLIRAGYPTLIWNRDIRKLRRLQEIGGTPCVSPKQVAEQAEFLIICVTDTDAVEKIVFGEGGIAQVRGFAHTLIDMSTCESEQTRSMAERLKSESSIDWLDAPISGGAIAAKEGRMTIMVGGSRSVFERAQPIWQVLGRRVTLMGASGAGQATKMINQLLVSSGLVMLAEACSLAEKIGVNTDQIPQALFGGRADSCQLQEMFPKMAHSEHSITARSNIMLKDLDMIDKLGQKNNLSLPLVKTTKDAFKKMDAAGLGDSDTSELIKLYRQQSLAYPDPFTS
ncbi:MAG: NAD(P)-dependent oxidoreductase [Proteobacteria bacterium]|nr:NAD(P)-dependent oxidoreductase [Pseudomonadota bacterium]MDA1330945.1 NAD(P)-dependent oxidoreductase [Pseudomonadota bacterium]